MLWTWAGAGALAFLISAFATGVMKRLARRLDIMDVPSGYKAHERATPLLGGCAMFLAFLAPSLLALAIVSYWSVVEPPPWLGEQIARHVIGASRRAPAALGILLGAGVLHVVGLIDDRRDLGPWLKLVAQTMVAAAVVVFCNVRILTATGAAVSIIATTVWLVAITNAFNFMDNMDGLSAGVAAICAAALLAASATMEQVFVSAWLCLLLGALLGFLPYNFPPASIFMGDAGSLVVGFLLGVLSCLTTYVHQGETYYLYGVFMPLIVLAVPLYDMLSVIVLRLRAGKSPMTGDRRHFSHRLVRRGMNVRRAVLTVYLSALATGISAFLLGRVSDNISAAVIFAQTAAILLIVALMESGDGKR
ncbi:MAG: undecaprenyl/decaprenyl-phosphate alpha-N-acetylglucosaminyl 1-phosphate transferase [Planctomycetes bacterium]|nr:undecaprenyl/decaprenyl-phosphate alpha-N-acetylglucosaminyl 1-phosphate transferase [Planctomycetota bacterium]